MGSTTTFDLQMKKLTLYMTLSFALNFSPLATFAQDATTNAAPAAAAAKKADPDLAQRVADLEAYVGNGTRGSDAADAKVTSKLDGVPGPGHNAWMMTSAALVLFMTLPGLALFYGGLVRRKNVLSVLAQCLGITGLVTILWVVCGYSITFHSGKPILGGLKFKFLTAVTGAPNGDYAAWVSQSVFAM